MSAKIAGVGEPEVRNLFLEHSFSVCMWQLPPSPTEYTIVHVHVTHLAFMCICMCIKCNVPLQLAIANNVVVTAVFSHTNTFRYQLTH